MPYSDNDIFGSGMKLHEAKEFSRAAAVFDELAHKNPGDAYLRLCAGQEYFLAGDLEKAKEFFFQVTLLDHHNVVAYIKLGEVYLREEKIDDAALAINKAHELQPKNLEVFFLISLLLQRQKKFQESLDNILVAIELAPDEARFYFNAANSYYHLEKNQEAIASYKHAIALDPNFGVAYYNLALLYRDLGEREKSIEMYQVCIDLNEHRAESYAFMAYCLSCLMRLDEAMECCLKSLKADPKCSVGHLNLAILYLLYGDYVKGWQEYEWRLKLDIFRTKESKVLDTKQYWDGQILPNESLVVFSEQGFGDNIQFLRFLSWARSRVGRLIVVIKEPLRPLMEKTNLDVEWSLGVSVKFKFDYYCYVLSLPKIFIKSVDEVPPPLLFLGITPKELPAVKLRVGIVWAGKPSYNNDMHRSCCLEDFLLLTKVAGVAFYSFQLNIDAKEKDQLEAHGVIDLSPQIKNFLDTAEYLLSMDLVITVDTALAHLAASLGKPTWALLAYYPDWRWMLNREDSPWYPSIKLFRLSGARQWHDLLQRVTSELQKTIS